MTKDVVRTGSLIEVDGLEGEWVVIFNKFRGVYSLLKLSTFVYGSEYESLDELRSMNDIVTLQY